MNTESIHRRKGSKRRNERGAVLMLFSLALIGTLLSAGLAVDLGGAYIARANLSKAVDAGALAGARYAGTTEDAALKTMIEKMALANYSGSAPAQYDIRVEHPGSDTTKVNLVGTTRYDTVFARLAGLDSFHMASAAEAIRYPLDMTLVLDLSLSLENNNVFDDMQRAATSFLDHFDDDADQIGLVTFSHWATNKKNPAKNNTSSIKSTINGADAIYYTNIEEGLRIAKDNLAAAPARTHAVKVVVLFTDGRSTALRDTFTMPSGTTPKTYDGVVAAYGSSSSSYVGLFQHSDGRKITKFSSKGVPTLASYSSSSSSPKPTKLPNGKSVTGTNVEALATTQAEAWASQIRDMGAIIFTIGLGNPNADPLDTPDLDHLQRIANEKGIVNGAQPQGELMFAPSAAELEAMFSKVADRILTRLTH
jgi:Flp pilus assembly protein TadG